MSERRDLRQRIIALIENDFSASEAARRCHVTLKTAQRRAHKLKIYGKFQRCYSTGHPHCSTREEDEAVCRVHEENPFCSANQIGAVANFPGPSQTVINHLRDANIHCRRAASKEGLTDDEAAESLTSMSFDCESRGHVYREPGIRYDTRYTQRRERSRRFSL